MGKVNHQIKSNFSQYFDLRSKRKTVLNSPIAIKDGKSNHKSIKKGASLAKHASIKSDIKFEIEVKADNAKDFKFKLFCPDLFAQPFFRYDASGPTHRNNDPDIPLKEQQVTTPHFHEFNDKGIEIAYKTAALKSPKDLTRLEEVNICIMHFCQEGNVRYRKTDFPEVNLHNDELGLTFITEDPLKNVNF